MDSSDNSRETFQAKLLKSNEFAFYLNTDSDQPSALLWGGVDQAGDDWDLSRSERPYASLVAL